MKLTKKAIENKYNVRLERGSFNMDDNYLSWKVFNKDGEEIIWCDTLEDVSIELKLRRFDF